MRSGSLSLPIASPKVLQFRFTNKIKIWLCFKCKVDIGTVMNVFWNCDKIKMYWKEIHKIIQLCENNTKCIGIVPEGIPSGVYSVQQVCVLTLIKNVYWIFVYILGQKMYTIIIINCSGTFSQYVVESGDYSFTTGKISLWFTSKIWGVL